MSLHKDNEEIKSRRVRLEDYYFEKYMEYLGRGGWYPHGKKRKRN